MSKPRDVVVVRVSEKGDREDEHFHSPEVQIEAARRWARDRLGALFSDGGACKRSRSRAIRAEPTSGRAPGLGTRSRSRQNQSHHSILVPRKPRHRPPSQP